jgi:hypothetical protein
MAKEETSAEISGGINTNVDYMVLDANKHLGSVYRTLSLVCFDLLSSAHY